MPRKPKPPPDDPEQFKRFIDMAHEVEADESPEAIDRAFDRIDITGQRHEREKLPPESRAASRRKRKGKRSDLPDR